VQLCARAFVLHQPPPYHLHSSPALPMAMVPACPPPAFMAPLFLDGHIESSPPVISPSFASPGKAFGALLLSHSRSTSTSAGSDTPCTGSEESLGISPPAQQTEEAQMPASPEGAKVEVVVRNTFLHVIGRPSSLDEFLEERLVMSCPVTRQPSVEDLTGLIDVVHGLDADLSSCADSGDEPTTGMVVGIPDIAPTTPTSPTVDVWWQGWVDEGTFDTTPVDPALPTADVWWQGWVEEDQAAWAAACMTPATVTATGAAEPRVLLRLDEALRAPELGTPEQPTVGSAGHPYGTCKPCAFFHRKGCINGVECRFCHLCGPRERKARMQQRWADQSQCAGEHDACQAAHSLF